MNDWTRQLSPDLWLSPGEDGQSDADFLRRVLGLRSGDAVLDAPCGDGRIALPLARAGCRVTGVDFTPAFTERAERRCREEGLEARFVVEDLRRMDFAEEFDAACCWGGSFGYFDEVENAAVVARFARVLKPGGRLVLDQPNRETLLRHFQATMVVGDVVRHNRWDPSAERVECDWVVSRTGPAQHNLLSIRLYTPAQLSRLFRSAGLELEARFGRPDGSPYTRSARRLIVGGRKGTGVERGLRARSVAGMAPPARSPQPPPES